jgi:hypothetical protein
MKFLDICVVGLVSVVCLNRLPSPLRNLKSDLIAKSRLTMLSAVSQLVGLLDACDYFAVQLSTVKAHHPGWIAVETIVLLSFGLLVGPACRSFLSGLFSNKPERTAPIKATPLPAKVSADETKEQEAHKDVGIVDFAAVFLRHRRQEHVDFGLSQTPDRRNDSRR